MSTGEVKEYLHELIYRAMEDGEEEEAVEEFEEEPSRSDESEEVQEKK